MDNMKYLRSQTSCLIEYLSDFTLKQIALVDQQNIDQNMQAPSLTHLSYRLIDRYSPP